MAVEAGIDYLPGLMRQVAVAFFMLCGLLGLPAGAAEPVASPARVAAQPGPTAAPEAPRALDAGTANKAVLLEVAPSADKVEALPAAPDARLPLGEDLKAPTRGTPDGSPDSTEPLPPEEISLGWTLLRTFVVLGIVILAIYITLNFGLRRLMGIAAVPRGQAVVQVVERIPLDQKRAMFVVKAAGEYLLIGGGDGALQLITKLDSEAVEKLQGQRTQSLTLSPLLQKLLKRRDAPVPPAPGDNS